MRSTLVAALVAALLWPTGASAATVDYVVDGDTVRLANGQYVRLIGIDTPEVGACGYAAAKAALDRLVVSQVALPNPASTDDADYYGRLLRYVSVGGRDAGRMLLRKGLATARYDSRDGYDYHPREAQYHRADAANPNIC